MSSESELESDEEFDYTFSKGYQSDMYNYECNCPVRNGRCVEDALRKAIWGGRINRVRRLLETAPVIRICAWCRQKDGPLAQPMLEAAVRGNKEIFEMVWEKYASTRSSWDDFHFAVTVASLFKFVLLRNVLERRFSSLGTSWDWDEPIMRAVEVISRPARMVPHYSVIEWKSSFQEVLPCCWQGRTPRESSTMAIVMDRRDSRGQSWRRETLQRFTSAVMAGDVTQVRNIMENGPATFFFRGDRLSDCHCDCDLTEIQYSCLQVLTSPICIAIARNQREVFFELMSAMNGLPTVRQENWIRDHSHTVFSVALVYGDPIIIRILLHYFFEKKGLCQVGIARVKAAVDVISSREDLSLLTGIRKSFMSTWVRHMFEQNFMINGRVTALIKLRNRKMLQLILQWTRFGLDVIRRDVLGTVFSYRFSSALRTILLLQIKIQLRCFRYRWSSGGFRYERFRYELLPTNVLSRWPEGVAMLIEDGLFNFKNEVRSLRHSCRIAIRRSLRQPIRDSVKKLPLPKKMKRMLIFHSLPVYDVDEDLTPFVLSPMDDRFCTWRTRLS